MDRLPSPSTFLPPHTPTHAQITTHSPNNRYILVTIDQQGRTTHPNTREMYKALYESYTESRMFYDLVLLGHRAALLLPLLVRGCVGCAGMCGVHQEM